jgi:hypothetical protein
MNLRRTARNAWACAISIALAASVVLAQDVFRGVDIRVVARKAVGGVRTVRVAQGETVELRVTADEPLELHVHGYDARLAVSRDQPARLALAARMAGRFPVTAHLHAAHAREPVLLYLEVLPR